MIYHYEDREGGMHAVSSELEPARVMGFPLAQVRPDVYQITDAQLAHMDLPDVQEFSRLMQAAIEYTGAKAAVSYDLLARVTTIEVFK